MTALIDVSNAEKTFTLHLHGGIELPVVRGVSFHVEPANASCWRPSGAGKSSILKMLYGNYRCDAGRIGVRHQRRGDRSRHRRAAAGARRAPRHDRLCQPVPAHRAARRRRSTSSPSRLIATARPARKRATRRRAAAPPQPARAAVGAAAGDLLRRRAAARRWPPPVASFEHVWSSPARSPGKFIPVTAKMYRTSVGTSPAGSSRASAARSPARRSSSSGLVLIRDLGSRNGTWVNGERLTSQACLRHGDRIGIGPLAFTALIEETRTRRSPRDRSDDVATWLIGDEANANAEGAEVPAGGTARASPARRTRPRGGGDHFPPPGGPVDEAFDLLMSMSVKGPEGLPGSRMKEGDGVGQVNVGIGRRGDERPRARR